MQSCRRYSYEGLKVKSQHLESLTAFVRCCRRYFPPTSAIEIWNEFRYVFVNSEVFLVFSMVLCLLLAIDGTSIIAA